MKRQRRKTLLCRSTSDNYDEDFERSDDGFNIRANLTIGINCEHYLRQMGREREVEVAPRNVTALCAFKPKANKLNKAAKRITNKRPTC